MHLQISLQSKRIILMLMIVVNSWLLGSSFRCTAASSYRNLVIGNIRSIRQTSLGSSKRSIPVASDKKDNLLAKYTARKLQNQLIKNQSDRDVDDSQPENLENIFVKNSQKLFDVDLEKVKLQVAAIRKVLGVRQFGVDVWFCSENKIRDLYQLGLGKRKSTDILSFPINDFIGPGIFSAEVEREQEKHLGDLIIAPAYVYRQMLRDQEDSVKYGDDYLDDEDAGVSAALATSFTLEERIPLLMVHGMLHLTGYDHESDSEWNEMTTKEEELIREIKAKNLF